MGTDSKKQIMLDVHLASSLFDEAKLEQLRYLLEEYWPHWSSKLSVARAEYHTKSMVLPDMTLLSVIQKVAPLKFGLSSSVFMGSYKEVQMDLDCCTKNWPPELNRFGVEIVGV